eukprot:COSAG01_NODE_49982_length_367_cov_1.320896_1_plen_53_part_10
MDYWYQNTRYLLGGLSGRRAADARPDRERRQLDVVHSSSAAQQCRTRRAAKYN